MLHRVTEQDQVSIETVKLRSNSRNANLSTYFFWETPLNTAHRLVIKQQSLAEARPDVIPTRFERVTDSLEGCCSIQLSYGDAIQEHYSKYYLVLQIK